MMQTRFHSLDAILLDYQHYWRFEPFHQSRYQLSRFKQNSALVAWLSSLDWNEIESLKQTPDRLQQALRCYLECTEELTELCLLPETSYSSHRLEAHQASGIPGRKLSQIEAMGSAAMAFHQGERWLEWCAGKGFLGRMLAVSSGQPVTSFEWQQTLCDKGQQSCDKLRLPVQFVHGDAFCCEKHHLLVSQKVKTTDFSRSALAMILYSFANSWS